MRSQDREPSKHSLVCSCHFVNMDKKNRPTLFEFNVKRKFNFESPEKRKRTVKAREVEANLLSALEATNISSEAAGPSKISETGTPSTSRSEGRLSSIEDIPSCSRSVSRASSASVEAENYFLKQEIIELTEILKNSTTRFSYEHIKNNDAHVLMYTGIPSNDLFLIVFETMDSLELNYYARRHVKLLPKIDQMLLTLMKLRLNLPNEDSAIRFSCSSATVTNIVMTWIYALHEVFFNQLMRTIPSRKKKLSLSSCSIFQLQKL